MKQNKVRDLSLRFFAGTVMVAVLFLFAVMAFFITVKLHAENTGVAKEGQLALTGSMGIAAPVYLNGQWEAFDGVIGGANFNPASLGTSGKQVQFPMGSIIQAKKDAAYRLRFSFGQTPKEPLCLAIPTFQGELHVYLNGEKQTPLPREDGWMSGGILQLMVPLTNLDATKEWQELVISADFSSRDVTLFKRPILMGTVQNVSTITAYDGFGEVFAFGLLILVIVNGCVFMLFRPSHMIISWITLFDATILARIFFSLNFTLGLARSISPNLMIPDDIGRSAELMCLMMGGLVGCILSGMIYDPEGRTKKWLTLPPPILYGIFGLVFPFRMDWFEAFGSTLLVLLYVYTFVAVYCQYSVCWRTKQHRIYYIFQFVRTSYVGIVVFWDIIFWHQYKDFSLLLYAYVVFFIMHVVVRLHDNNQSYVDVEVLNQGLEGTVAARTQELSNANQILSDLSIRDPLTHSFNRLYFERAMEKALALRANEPRNLHLCIFDLDLFKKVNDTFGHDTGDEVLHRAAEITRDAAPSDVVFARIGGEEFILLFEDYTTPEVLASVEAVRQAFENNAKENSQHTTASFGIAIWSAGDTMKGMLKKADGALYQAKDAGRNCVMMAEE